MNNKGFAITTILYGTFLLFMMLLLVMLGILSRYKDNLSILMDETNGARDIVDIYDAGSLFMTIGENKYYKDNDGLVIIGVIRNVNSGAISPLLVSTEEEAVYFNMNGVKKSQLACDTDVNNTKYYFNCVEEFWTWDDIAGIYDYSIYEAESFTDAAKKLLKDKLKIE